MKRLFSSLWFLACILFALSFLVVSIAKTRSAQITFAWDPNPEPDIYCYRIYKTTTPGQYTFVKDNPDDNDLVWEGTENTAIVTAEEASLFVVTAVDMAGNESDPSDEVAYQAVQPSPAPGYNVPLTDDENGVNGGASEGSGAEGGCFVGTAIMDSPMDQ